MSSLEIRVRMESGATVVSLTGMGDVAHMSDIEPDINRIIESNPDRLVLDLTGLTFISSLGIGQIVVLCDATLRDGGSVRIACPPGNVRGALERCKLDNRFTFDHSFDDALSGVGV